MGVWPAFYINHEPFYTELVKYLMEETMLPLKDMYPVICTQLKNQSKQQGREEITLVEVQDAFAWEFGMTNRKTVDPHIARMVRMGFLENTNGGKTFRLTGGQGKNGKKA